MLLRPLLLASLLFAVAGCQTPQDIQQLQNRTAELEQQLADSKQQLVELEAERARLESSNNELNRVISVLGQEKSSRVEESTSLRGQVRGFVQNQIDDLKRFVLNSNLVDYIGSEQVPRKLRDDQPRLVVDMANPVPADGTLTGVGALFNKAGQLTVKVLRPVKGRLVVIWESLPLAVDGSGEQRINFSASVGVQRGDLVAYYFSTPGLVSYDQGTGDSRYTLQDLSFGESIKPSSLDGEDDRLAYSIGVYGLLATR